MSDKYTFSLVESDCDSKTNIPAITFPSTCNSKDICRSVAFPRSFFRRPCTMANKLYINFILLYNNMKIVTSTYTIERATRGQLWRGRDVWDSLRGKLYESFSNKFRRKWKTLTSQRAFRGEQSGSDTTESEVGRSRLVIPSNPLRTGGKVEEFAWKHCCSMHVIPLCTHILKHYYLSIRFFRHFYYFEDSWGRVLWGSLNRRISTYIDPAKPENSSFKESNYIRELSKE
jgi:hypothetical protein